MQLPAGMAAVISTSAPEFSHKLASHTDMQMGDMQDIRLRTGRPVLLLEVVKPSPASTSEDVGALSAQVTTVILAL